MKECKPLLSIVVPTKGRYPYLFKLLEIIQSYKFENIEVVVQDNNEDNTPILEYFKEKGGKPSYIVYDWRQKSIPIYLNADYSVLNSTGEYICFIGDDDAVCPQVIKAVEYMKKSAINVLLSSSTFYNWPDFYDPSIFNLKSAIQFIKGTGKIVKVDVSKELDRCIKRGFDGLYKMPRAYQAIVSRDIMDKVYSIYGSYFPGPSPDMANAIALSLLNPITYYFDGPLVISGQSRGVGGGERLLKSNQLKKLHEVQFLPSNIYEIWDNRLPRFWCADTIWPQSAIGVLQGQSDLLSRVNYNIILARFIFYHRSYYSDSKKLIESDIKFKIAFVSFFIHKLCIFLRHRISYIVSNKRRLGKYRIERNILDMKAAVNYLSIYSFK